MLKQFTIDNFKSLIEFSFPPMQDTDSLPHFSCLVGTNGAGKSTILQAFDFIHHLASGTLESWLKARGWKLNELTSRFSEKRTITFKLVIAEGSLSYQWSGSFNTVTSRCTTEAIYINSNPAAVMSISEGILRYKRGNDHITASAKDYSYKGSILSFLKSDPDSMPEIAAVKKFVEGLKSLELLNPQLIKTRSREADDVGSGGEKLAGYLSHLPKDRSEEIVVALRKFYPQVIQARPQSLRAGWKTYWITEDYKATQKIRLETEIQHLSDGMLRILTIIAQVLSDREFILLDEIENGMNPELVEQLMDYLVTSKKQILVTTHSPMVLNYLDDEVAKAGVFLVYKSEDGITRCGRYFGSSITQEKLDLLGPGEVYVDTAIESVAKDLEKNRT
ncbi:MAG: AAA family ATPase [Sphaerochaeta sp.]|nr:AAA family ATPase [Sphaerochaeta sp.]